jgi:hypothetical protein
MRVKPLSCEGSFVAATMPGKQTRSVSMLIIIGSAVAARCGRTPKRMSSARRRCTAALTAARTLARGLGFGRDDGLGR